MGTICFQDLHVVLRRMTVLLLLAMGGLVTVAATPTVAQTAATDPAEDDGRAPPPRSVIRFLTDNDYPPYHYRDEDNVLTGFNVSVARAICLELDVSCEIEAREWSDLLPAVNQGEADAVIASIAKTPDTLARVDFSRPYHFTPGRFAVRRNTPAFELTPAGLAARRVGVIAGTAHEAYVRTYFPDADVQTYGDAADVRTALRLGRLDALFDDAANMALWMNGTDARGCCVFRGEAYYEPLFFGDGVAIAVRKGNRDLLTALNEGINKIRRNGRLEEIFLQFFPIKIY